MLFLIQYILGFDSKGQPLIVDLTEAKDVKNTDESCEAYFAWQFVSWLYSHCLVLNIAVTVIYFLFLQGKPQDYVGFSMHFVPFIITWVDFALNMITVEFNLVYINIFVVCVYLTVNLIYVKFFVESEL